MFYGPAEAASKQISRAGDASWTAVDHVSIDHRGLHIAVPKQLLNGADVGSTFQEMGGKTVPECMAARWLGDSSASDGYPDGTLNHGWVEMVSALLTALAVTPAGDLGESPLPHPLP